jgi:hypothetical protein
MYGFHKIDRYSKFVAKHIMSDIVLGLVPKKITKMRYSGTNYLIPLFGKVDSES